MKIQFFYSNGIRSMVYSDVVAWLLDHGQPILARELSEKGERAFKEIDRITGSWRVYTASPKVTVKNVRKWWWFC